MGIQGVHAANSECDSIALERGVAVLCVCVPCYGKVDGCCTAPNRESSLPTGRKLNHDLICSFWALNSALRYPRHWVRAVHSKAFSQSS